MRGNRTDRKMSERKASDRLFAPLKWRTNIYMKFNEKWKFITTSNDLGLLEVSLELQNLLLLSSSLQITLKLELLLLMRAKVCMREKGLDERRESSAKCSKKLNDSRLVHDSLNMINTFNYYSTFCLHAWMILKTIKKIGFLRSIFCIDFCFFFLFSLKNCFNKEWRVYRGDWGEGELPVSF